MERIEELKKMSLKDLFSLHESIYTEMQRRNIVHSSNNLISNYSEKLVCKALSLRSMPESNKGYDAIDAEGKKYEIKGRRPTKNKSRQLSALRNLDASIFDFLVVVIFQSNFGVLKAVKIPHKLVSDLATFSEHTNSWIFQARDEVWNLPSVVDISAQVKEAEKSIGEIFEFPEIIEEDIADDTRQEDNLILNQGILVHFPGAKRIKNTSTFQYAAKKILIKRSRVYDDGIHYWFGVTESDIERFNSGEISSLNLLCIGKGFVVLENELCRSIFPKLNMTEKANNLYHIHIYYHDESKILLAVKTGERIDIGKMVKRLAFNQK